MEQISEETLVENGVSIHSDYPGDAMVYLTQRWLNQEYGNVPGFGYVTEDGRTGVGYRLRSYESSAGGTWNHRFGR